LIQRRFVHMDRMHLAALETTIIPENWSAGSRSFPAWTEG
jgi:trehalose/maltose hydrolase-like predicted phosphorylase